VTYQVGMFVHGYVGSLVHEANRGALLRFFTVSNISSWLSWPHRYLSAASFLLHDGRMKALG